MTEETRPQPPPAPQVTPPLDQCGVVGVIGDPGAEAIAVRCLESMVHRGGAGAGIAWVEGDRLRAQGVAGAPCALRPTAPSVLAIGHIRHAQGDGGTGHRPLVARYLGGWLAIALDGGLVNATALRDELFAAGSLFTSGSHAEIVAHLFATSRQTTAINRLVDALYRVRGACSLVAVADDKLVAVRDPHGFRPLALGRSDSAWIVASESCAFEAAGGALVREVDPGEVIIIDRREGVLSLRPFPDRPRRACAVEILRLARADTQMSGASVYSVRLAVGRLLAREAPAAADVVVAVREGVLPVAIGFSIESGIPLQQGLLWSDGSPLPVRDAIAGRRVVLVDDAIARGEASRRVVGAVRAAGAREVHVRIASPRPAGACCYGVEMPLQAEIVAAGLGLGEVNAWLGADSLSHLSVEALRLALGGGAESACNACFTGDYPVPPAPAEPAAQLPLFVERR